MTRQLINLVGGLVAVLVLVAGVLLIGLPMYSNAQATAAEADQVALGNQTQQTIIDGLRAQEKKSDELDAELAKLRRQIAPEPRADDIVALAIAAVGAHHGTLDSVTVAEAEPFAVRVAEQADGAADAAAPQDGDQQAQDGDQTGQDGDQTAQGAAEPASASTAAPADAAAAGDDTRQQVPVTLVITAESVVDATSIVDALRAGPRVVAVTDAATTTDDQGVHLTVTALVFVNKS
ncbi:hypothetical protein L2X99_00705 [Microbacterium sp. KUDC0406]|uniref:hypothetical protein n=1 Tax=Microbacterium sp. KUDC0406 TaxID=2909588 RepID=UPI001F402746|nr:hypothetical protein [Microbacterium sp. KUDC0406]UJP10277.1 hypothetical protein L2X99_00705 [Microbacterium sp. KUDC0406]